MFETIVNGIITGLVTFTRICFSKISMLKFRKLPLMKSPEEAFRRRVLVNLFIYIILLTIFYACKSSTD